MGPKSQPDSTAQRGVTPEPPLTPASEESLARRGESVFEEPDIFPGGPAEVVDRDWSCSQCGYNLRGLEAGHPCPECGHREIYRPAPPGTRSYRTWIEGRLARTSPSAGWFVALTAAVLGGPFAVIGAVFGGPRGGPVSLSGLAMVVALAPTMEETLKIALAAYVVELRPYLFRRAGQIVAAAVGSAFVFAAIENFIYLNIYVPHPSQGLFIWRWTICVALHVGCSAVAATGLIEIWKQAVSELRPPRLTQGLSRLMLAIGIHGTYNALAALYGLSLR
jgi:predicted RNA-binding Zn-ribbon protein involved in translation (DUF1610 family)